MAWKKPHFYFRACTMFRDGEEDRGKIIGECVAAFPFMWLFVSAAACHSCLMPADLVCLSVCECHPLFVMFAACWPLSHSVSACQLASAAPFFLSCSLFTDPLLLDRMWVLPLICPICNCWPAFAPQDVNAFVLFTACWPLFLTSAHQDVSTIPVCPFQFHCFLTFLSLCCQLVRAIPCHGPSHLPTVPADLFSLPACECCPLFILCPLLADLCLSSPACECGPLFSYLPANSVFICLCSPECKCCVLFIYSLPADCTVSVCQYVSAAPCLSCPLPSELSLAQHVSCLCILFAVHWPLLHCHITRMWVLLMHMHPVYRLLTRSVSPCQLVSVAPNLSYWLPDFSITLSLCARKWVLPLLCPVYCLLISLLFCPCLPGCECCPQYASYLPTNFTLCACQLVSCPSCILFTACSPLSFFFSACQDVNSPCLFHLLPADLCLSLSLLASLWVLLHVCPVFCLLISFISMWVLPLRCPFHCLLTSLAMSLLLACECWFLFVLFAACWPLVLFLFVRMWVPPLMHFVCYLLTSLSLFHCLHFPGCKCHPLLVLFATCWCSLSCSVSACQIVNAVPCASHFLPADLSFLLCISLPACECCPSSVLFAACCQLISLLLFFNLLECECCSSYVSFAAC